MKIYRIFFFSLLLHVPNWFGQSQAKQMEEADELFNRQLYASAFPIYQSLLKSKVSDAAIHYKLGLCYLNSRSQKIQAIPFLEKAVELSSWKSDPEHLRESDAPIIACKHLGEAYFHAHKFSPAISAYQKYKELLIYTKNNHPETIQALDSKIELCRFAKELRTAPLFPLTSGKNIDFTSFNYSTSLSPDKSAMIYTFRVPVTELKKSLEEDQWFEKNRIFEKNKFISLKRPETEALKTPDGVNIDTIDYATTIGTSFDGQIVLTYRNDKGNANLYISRLKKNNWSLPEQLSETVNLRGWESNECISSDGNVMYFTSDRPGGYGGSDIYMCKKSITGEWSKAVNLGTVINSHYDEVAPFIHPDGKTLYFSSNRVTASSFDVFSSVREDSSRWSVPVNVGYPVNRNENDIFQVSSAKKNIFSTGNNAALNSKKDTLYNNSLTDEDCFLLTCGNSQKEKLTLLKGEIRAASGKTPLHTKITVTDNSTEEIMGVYHTDCKTGRYIFILPYEKNNNIIYEAPGCLFVSENLALDSERSYFEKYHVIDLPPLANGSVTKLNNVFFEDGSTVIRPSSATELNRIVSLLKQHPQMKAGISSYIYSDENKKHYRKLSKARAVALVNYLIEKGIKKENLIAEGYRKNPAKIKKNRGEKDNGNHEMHDQKIEFRIIKM